MKRGMGLIAFQLSLALTCTGCSPHFVQATALDVSRLECDEILWRHGNAALKRCLDPALRSNDPYVLVFERVSGGRTNFWRLDEDGFAVRVSGHTLCVHDARAQEFPGWYSVERYNKGGFAKTFSSRSIGRWSKIPGPAGVEPPKDSAGGVYVYHAGTFRRVAETAIRREIFDIDAAEGLCSLVSLVSAYCAPSI